MASVPEIIFNFETPEQLEVFDFPIPFASGEKVVRLCVVAKGSGGDRPPFFRCFVMPSVVCDHVELTDKKYHFDLPILMVQDYIRSYRECLTARILERRRERAAEDAAEPLCNDCITKASH